MSEPVDTLRIKIDKARAGLSPETRDAIDAVDWKAAILAMREKHGYTFEQLGDMEIETELLLAGLVTPTDYPKELETRMGISKEKAQELVEEMNDLVFKKIREELIKRTERKKETPEPASLLGDQVAKSEPEQKSEEIQPARSPEGSQGDSTSNGTHPMLEQKLKDSFQIKSTKTEHSLDNLSKTGLKKESSPKPAPSAYPKNADPYREIPEE